MLIMCDVFHLIYFGLPFGDLFSFSHCFKITSAKYHQLKLSSKIWHGYWNGQMNKTNPNGHTNKFHHLNIRRRRRKKNHY